MWPRLYAKLVNIEQEEKEAPGKFLDRLEKPFTGSLRLILKV